MQYQKVRIKEKKGKIIDRRVMLNQEQYVEIDLEVSTDQIEENYKQAKEPFK